MGMHVDVAHQDNMYGFKFTYIQVTAACIAVDRLYVEWSRRLYKLRGSVTDGNVKSGLAAQRRLLCSSSSSCNEAVMV